LRTALDTGKCRRRRAGGSCRGGQKIAEDWDFADALHHALAAGCDDFANFDTNLARRAGRDDSTASPVIAI